MTSTHRWVYLNLFQIVRRKLTTMKIADGQMSHVLRPGVVKLVDIFKRHGYEIRVAGGAVRDLLMGEWTPLF